MMYDLVEYRVVKGVSEQVSTLYGTYEDVDSAKTAMENRKTYIHDVIRIINRAVKNREPEQEIRNYVKCLRFNPFNVRGYRIVEHPEAKQKSKPQSDLVQPKLWDQAFLDQDLWTEEPWC